MALMIPIFAGCGVNRTLTHDFAQTTVAPLNQNNFKVVKRVSGESSVTKIFGIGGLSDQYLQNSAVSAMYDNANLTGAQTIVDVKVVKSSKLILFPVYAKHYVKATGTVIEFVAPPVDLNPKSVKIMD